MSAPVNHDYDRRAQECADIASYYAEALLINVAENGAHLRSDFALLIPKMIADLQAVEKIISDRIAQETIHTRKAA